MNLKGSQTEKNLLAAFAGESQARNRYTYFASQAKKEGYEQIAAIFEETANQEKEHAKREFKFLEGGEVEITAAFRWPRLRRYRAISVPAFPAAIVRATKGIRDGNEEGIGALPSSSIAITGFEVVASFASNS